MKHQRFDSAFVPIKFLYISHTSRAAFHANREKSETALEKRQFQVPPIRQREKSEEFLNIATKLFEIISINQ